jgi:Anti-sigma factor NepR
MRSELNHRFPIEPPATRDDPRPDLVCDSAIGRTLRKHYRALSEEPLPERFLSLLSTLVEKDARHEK